MRGEDYSSRLMAKDVVTFYYHGANAAGVPEVNIRAEGIFNSCLAYSRFKVDQGGGGGQTTDPQIPVLLMAIVTSPSPRVSPFFISSRLGLVSATQRSWAGFV